MLASALTRATKNFAAATVFAVLAIFAVPASAQVHLDPDARDPDFLSVAAGVFDINAENGVRDYRSAAVQFEYAGDQRFWVFHPIAGAMLNSDMGSDVYAGVAIDFFFGNRWVVTPGFAPSAYMRGSSKNLGEILEFRSSIDVAYRFDDRSRLGLELYHLSNAGLSDRNPGTELLLLKYSVPFGKIGGN